MGASVLWFLASSLLVLTLHIRDSRQVRTREDDALSDRLSQRISLINEAKTGTHRVHPLHPGAMHPAPDFNAPLEGFASYV